MKFFISHLIPMLFCWGNLTAQNLVDEEGHKQGKWIVKDQKGYIAQICNYVNDTLNGPFVNYLGANKVFQEGAYLGGVLNGHFIEYDKKGKLFKDFYFKGGLLDSTARHYLDGRLTMLARFHQGKLDGRFYSYFKNGYVHTVTYFQNGCLCGGTEIFDAKGRKTSLLLPLPYKVEYGSEMVFLKNGMRKYKHIKNPKPDTWYIYGERYHSLKCSPMCENEE